MLAAGMFFVMLRISVVIFHMPDPFTYVEWPVKRILFGRTVGHHEEREKEELHEHVTEDEDEDEEDDSDENTKKTQ